ncbi:hypothetical protein H6768_00280 [Candidatus Peribacteria bacterium]|nr:hypothetical protein [Candidatus Peribacteria bacterium]
MAGVLLTVGDLVLNAWVDSGDSWKLYTIGILFYFIALNFLAKSYKFENIAVASVIMEVLNLVSYLAISYWKFGETIARLEILGIAFGIAAIVCFEFA